MMPPRAGEERPLRLSVIVEWANTRLNGVPRAWSLFGALAKQWRELTSRAYPETLPHEEARFLDRIDHRAELLVASGDVLRPELEQELRARVPEDFDLKLLLAEGHEYYPLKNCAAEEASGDLLLFVDSDVLPDEGWLAHLIGSFGHPEVDVVCGQTYVAPTDLFARAFALGWTYAPRDASGKLFRARKFYANTIAFRTEIFRRTGFPSIGPRRTRGAASILGKELERIGVPVWENPLAGVDHPPPADFRHLAIRALAHGRDHYMTRSDERNLYGLARSVGIATYRLGRGWYRIARYGRQVGLRPWEVPAAFGICSTYYGLFALGGILSHACPGMMGNRFRV